MSVTIWSKGFALPFSMPHWRLNTGSPPTISGSSAFTRLKSNRMVRSPRIVAPRTSPKMVRYCGALSLLTSRSNECFTSAASTVSPLEKRAAGCRRNTTESRSGATATSSASSP
jgi:hypothetical protein